MQSMDYCRPIPHFLNECVTLYILDKKGFFAVLIENYVGLIILLD